MTKWGVYWDIGHDCGVFLDRYDSEEEAAEAAADIEAEQRIIGIWDDECYAEAIEIPDRPDEPPAHQIEGTIDHFDRYIAGDRR